MKLSTKSRYALEAMLFLAASPSGKPASIREISKGTGLSESYLEQIFFRLRKMGLLTASRGASGGYCLSREPSAITAGEIVRAMEEHASPVVCVEDPAHCKDRLTACCRTRSLWMRLADEIYRTLDARTLSDLREGYASYLAQKEEVQ